MQKSFYGKQIEISDVINISILQEVQDAFAQAVGMAAVTVDRRGKPITRTSNFQPLCLLRRSTAAGLIRCQASDDEGGRVAYERGRPYAYTCGGGLMDAAAPITIEGEYVGSILCGQVVPTVDRDQFIADAVERNVALGLPREEVVDLARQIPVMPRRRFEAGMEMLSLVANYIVQMGASQLVQEQLLKEAQEKVILQAALQEAQLRALKAQINPHFLFNSLTLVAYTALEENAPRTEEIAYILSDLLRYSLRSMSTSVELHEEVEMIEHYLAIQRLRFGDRLRWQCNIDPAVRQVSVPCMVLQPLVENAIIHGAEPLTRPVTITIAAWRENGQVRLVVEDDGAGMEPALAAAIGRGELPQRDEKPSLGLQNVSQRLAGEFGREVGLKIDGRPDKGTKIDISIPCQGAENDSLPAAERGAGQ